MSGYLSGFQLEIRNIVARKRFEAIGGTVLSPRGIPSRAYQEFECTVRWSSLSEREIEEARKLRSV